MTSAQSKRQKLAGGASAAAESGSGGGESTGSGRGQEQQAEGQHSGHQQAKKLASSSAAAAKANNFGVDVDDLTDTDSDQETDNEDDDDLDEDAFNTATGANGRSGGATSGGSGSNSGASHADIQEQLAAAGPAGVAAAAAIATARKRKRPHSFETNPSVRKRQQTRLIRKLRACIDEYTMRVGQQAVVLITMPGKALHNFKVFGAQPLESVIRACKHEIMAELEQALLEQAPQQFKADASKHELPPLVIDGIPTPVEKMTQAQLRAFIPLMLKYSTGRGKPGWGKDTTRPPWWPETLPWANVRSDARDEDEKQRISWTTTLRQIVTNCYKFHGRDDLLPTFDENEEQVKQEQEQAAAAAAAAGAGTRLQAAVSPASGATGAVTGLGRPHRGHRESNQQHHHQQQHQQQLSTASTGAIYSSGPAYASNFVHTISNGDGTVSLIQVDPANAQILTLPDGTQVRAVRLQTLGAESLIGGQQLGELHEQSQLEPAGAGGQAQQQHQASGATGNGSEGGELGAGALAVTEASLGSEGQIIVTGEDGLQSCYPMSSLVSIPASMYQQLAQSGQQLSIVTADGQSLSGGAISIHAIQEDQLHEQQVQALVEQQQQQQRPGEGKQAGGSGHPPPEGASGESSGDGANNKSANEGVDVKGG